MMQFDLKSGLQVWTTLEWNSAWTDAGQVCRLKLYVPVLIISRTYDAEVFLMNKTNVFSQTDHLNLLLLFIKSFD
jgi:hypothetical protein